MNPTDSDSQARSWKLTPEQLVLGSGVTAAADFLAFRSALIASLQPAGELEFLAFENLLAAQWGLRRLRTIEAHLASTSTSVDPLLDPSLSSTLRQLDAAARRHERSFERNLKLLRELQSEREFRRLAGPGAVAASATAPLANLAEVRRAHFYDRSAQSRLDAAALSAALDRLLSQPLPQASNDSPTSQGASPPSEQLRE